MNKTKHSRARVAPDESALCQFPFADGRTCRMLRQKSHPSLCIFHARQEQQLLEQDRIGDELASLSGDFQTVSDINHVIGKLFKLVAAGRIPARTAETLAYLSQLLLYSQHSVRQEIISAQNYTGWKEILYAIYPDIPHTPPRPEQANHEPSHQ
jgi:hypothetical protein